MKINKTWKIVLPVVAGALAISTGVGVAFAKGNDLAASYQPAANYAQANPSGSNNSPVGYCGGGVVMMSGQRLVTPQLANLLGTTVTDLQTQLDAGETLAELARAKGISQAQVLQTLMAPFNDRMGLMLKYGYLTQDQINSMTQGMQEWLQNFVTKGSVSDGDAWDFMNDMMQDYSGAGYGMMGGGYNGTGAGMMGGWANPSQQSGTSAQPAPRAGFGGMMGSRSMMGTW